MSLIYYLILKPRGYEQSPIYTLGHEWDYGAFVISNLYAFALAVVALFIFAMMTAISNQYAIHELGGVWWRRLLRVGYVAYISATLHFLIKNVPEWLAMFATPEPELPPLNFMIFLLVLGVIGLRLALWYSLWKKSRATTATPSVLG
jgi:DMSO/TMAO reductase YedYZ heme-binding membrane subunit